MRVFAPSRPGAMYFSPVPSRTVDGVDRLINDGRRGRMEANHGAGQTTTAGPDSVRSAGPVRHPDLNTAPVAGKGRFVPFFRAGARIVYRRVLVERRIEEQEEKNNRRHGAVAMADKRIDDRTRAAIRRRAHEPAD